MSDIRLTYSGLIAFAIRLVSVITGIIFTIIVTRNLTPDEFGLWRLIGSLIYYVVIIEPITSYWVSRHIARGEEAAKTGLFTNGFFSAGACAAYLLMIYFVAPATNSSYSLLLLSTILIPALFISNTLDNINLGFKPQAISYSFLMFELLKIPAGLILVEVIRMGLAGAIIATLIAYLARNLVAFYFAKTKLHERFNFQLVKRWLRLSWLPLYTNIANLIFVLDVLIFSVIVASVKPLALYGAAMAISTIVAHSGAISQALYPKLLADNKKEYVEYILRRLFVFGIPLFAAIIVFAKPALFVLNPIYIAAEPVVYISAITAFAYAMMSTFYGVLTGIEKVDVGLNSKVSEYFKSKLFTVPTLAYIQYGAYVGLLALMLLIAKPLGFADINLIVFWVEIGLVTQIPFTIYAWRLAKRYLPFSFPIQNIARYTLAAAVAVSVLYFVNQYILVYDKSIFVFGPKLLLALSIGGATYFSIVYSLDRDFKMLIKAIIKELALSRGSRS